MSDIHIDDFCKDVAKILNQLYLSFPRASALYVEDIAGYDEPDEFGLHSPRHLACLGAMLWLAEEGYIRYQDTIRHDAVDQAVLASRTFTVLSAVTDSLTEEETEELPEGLPEEVRRMAREGFGERLPPSVLRSHRIHVNRLRQALKSRSSDRIRAVVLDVLARASSPGARPAG